MAMRTNLRSLPSLRAQEHEQDPIVYARFRTRDSRLCWYAIEGQPDGEDFLFFGYIVGESTETGFFSRSELEAVSSLLHTALEEDPNFRPTRRSKIPVHYWVSGGDANCQHSMAASHSSHTS